MPRSAASRTSVAGPQTQDIEPEELLPVRLTQTQWVDMSAYEEAEEAVAEHMEILLKKVMDGCFRVEIRQQLCPYTATWIKKCLVQIVEQHFLCRDGGDGPEEVLPEDSEPPPAEPDAWAQGCVPLVSPSTPQQPISPKDEDIVQKEVELKVLPKSSELPQPKVSLKLPSKTCSNPAVVTNNKLHNTFTQSKIEKKNNHVPMRAKPSKFLPPLSHFARKHTSKTENSEVEIRMSTVSNKSVPSNLLTKHKAIERLDPASLPDHCIFPKYEIVDSNAKSRKSRQNIPQPKHMEPEWTLKPPRCEVDVRPKHGAVISSGPIRLEAMTLAKGVTLSQSAELNQISAPPQPPPQTPPGKLKPIRTEPSLFTFSVDQFVPGPQVKPLSQT
ncbi:hypothetical protein NQD34_002268 [Periophthalmus magnuspinnatus]|nr:hypothetical protein NQD34_002268 [Periophthalmus magnuspinnatus]